MNVNLKLKVRIRLLKMRLKSHFRAEEYTTEKFDSEFCYKSYEEGVGSFESGFYICDNPYHIGDYARYISWQHGWIDAKSGYAFEVVKLKRLS